MRKRWLVNVLFLLNWVLWFVVGIVVNLRYAGQIRAQMIAENVGWAAAADLPANHQIQASDLIASGTENLAAAQPPIDTLTGRYLRSAVKSGESISPSDLLPLPAILQRKDGAAILTYNLRPDESFLARMLDPGRQVKICATSAADAKPVPACLAVSLEVLAVHQENGADVKNWLLLRVPPEIPTDLSTYLANDHRYILVTAP